MQTRHADESYRNVQLKRHLRDGRGSFARLAIQLPLDFENLDSIIRCQFIAKDLPTVPKASNSGFYGISLLNICEAPLFHQSSFEPDECKSIHFYDLRARFHDADPEHDLGRAKLSCTRISDPTPRRRMSERQHLKYTSQHSF